MILVFLGSSGKFLEKGSHIVIPKTALKIAIWIFLGV